MITKRIFLLGIILVLFSFSCKKTPITTITQVTTKPINTKPPDTVTTPPPRPPNIIFLLADDMGFEMPTFDGGQSYNTTHLDSLAASSMVFTQCRATPLCSPSRVEMLSGLYNFRNYLQYGWGVYNTQYTSFAKTLQTNGYKTCVVGKWQLDGGNVGIADVGFDDYCVWHPTQAVYGNLYENPYLYEAGSFLPGSATSGKYSEDVTGDYAMNFIDQNKNQPFFLYYSFMLIHEPFQPTPLDLNVQTFDENNSDTTYVGSMTHYLDIKVGQLMTKLKADGLIKNTIIVFSGDNGSLGAYHSIFKGKQVRGEKGQTQELGVHVPLFVNWPGHIMPGVNNNMVDYTDLAPTFLDMANVKHTTPGDGFSFYPQLFGNNDNTRNWTYCYYDPYPFAIGAANPQTQPISFAQDTAYKLYKTGTRSGKFYHFSTDIQESRPLVDSLLTPAQAAIKQKLQTALSGLQ